MDPPLPKLGETRPRCHPCPFHVFLSQNTMCPPLGFLEPTSSPNCSTLPGFLQLSTSSPPKPRHCAPWNTAKWLASSPVSPLSLSAWALPPFPLQSLPCNPLHYHLFTSLPPVIPQGFSHRSYFQTLPSGNNNSSFEVIPCDHNILPLSYLTSNHSPSFIKVVNIWCIFSPLPQEPCQRSWKH